jgi:hypothetical protein
MTQTQEASEQAQGERNHREQAALARLEAELDAQPEGEDNDLADNYDPRDSWRTLEDQTGINVCILKAVDMTKKVERVRGIQI